MEAGERRSVQERCTAAQHEANEIFEDRLIDCSAVKFQNYAIKPINIDHKTGLIVRLKRYRGGNGWRYSYHALLHETAAIFHPSARVLQSRFIESLLHRRLTAERNFNRQRFGSDDFIIDVDFIDKFLNPSRAETHIVCRQLLDSGRRSSGLLLERGPGAKGDVPSCNAFINIEGALPTFPRQPRSPAGGSKPCCESSALRRSCAIK